MGRQKPKETLPKFKPGDKIYKLFAYDKVIIIGNSEEFVVNVRKRKKASS